jgi:hypothetical protein
MSAYLRKLRAILMISLIRGPDWAAMFTVFLYILQIFLPPDGDVGTVRLLSIIAWVGLVSGAIFGLLLALNESGKAVQNLSLLRVMMWGIVSSAVYPVVTQRANQVFWTCAFGAIAAVALVAIARVADLRNLNHPKRLLDIFLVSTLIPVRDAISPLEERAS